MRAEDSLWWRRSLSYSYAPPSRDPPELSPTFRAVRAEERTDQRLPRKAGGLSISCSSCLSPSFASSSVGAFSISSSFFRWLSERRERRKKKTIRSGVGDERTRRRRQGEERRTEIQLLLEIRLFQISSCPRCPLGLILWPEKIHKGAESQLFAASRTRERNGER